MLPQGFRILLSVCLISLFLHSFSAEAQPSSQDPLEEVLHKVSLIEERVKKIETDQQETLNRQEKILRELDNLRVWVARR